jgi:hypothetical protein
VLVNAYSDAKVFNNLFELSNLLYPSFVRPSLGSARLTSLPSLAVALALRGIEVILQLPFSLGSSVVFDDSFYDFSNWVDFDGFHVTDDTSLHVGNNGTKLAVLNTMSRLNHS